MKSFIFISLLTLNTSLQTLLSVSCCTLPPRPPDTWGHGGSVIWGTYRGLVGVIFDSPKLDWGGYPTSNASTQKNKCLTLVNYHKPKTKSEPKNTCSKKQSASLCVYEAAACMCVNLQVCVCVTGADTHTWWLVCVCLWAAAGITPQDGRLLSTVKFYYIFSAELFLKFKLPSWGAEYDLRLPAGGD